ncbi:hypothetical protein D1007_00254 [Hordeum vulgare]|nr:hypothetical protein D1007_00254 [Hordeum vulgare]
MDIGEDWVESAADNSWITPGIDPALAFRVAVIMEVLQPRGNDRDSGKGVGKSCVSTNSERLGTPCRSKPSRVGGSESHNMIAASSCSNSPVFASAANVEQDAEPDEEVPRLADEDEKTYLELVDKVSQQAMEDEYKEEPISGAEFDDTDDEDREENIDSLVNKYDGDDMPTIEWNREDPQLAVSTVFQWMLDCCNAMTTFSILTKNDYVVIRSEPKRFTVKCPYTRCRWNLHASNMLRSKVIQIKRNEHQHTCPPGGGGVKAKTKLAKTRAAYASNVCALLGKDQWKIVDPRFKLNSPVLTRPPGRPRKNGYRGVDASFGEEERWVAPNAEENAAGEEIATIAEESAVETLSEAEAMAYEGFEALWADKEALIPFRIVERADDRQMVITFSGNASSASPTTPPQVKRNKKLIQHPILFRETRSKTVKPSGHTRSKSKF